MGSGISKLNGFLIVERLAVCRLTERLAFFHSMYIMRLINEINRVYNFP